MSESENNQIVITPEQLQAIAAVMLLQGLNNKDNKLSKALLTIKIMLWLSDKSRAETIKEAVSIFDQAVKTSSVNFDIEQIKRMVQ